MVALPLPSHPLVLTSTLLVLLVLLVLALLLKHLFLWAVDRTCKAQHILGYVREAAGMWHVVLIFLSMAGGQVMALKRHTMGNTTVLSSICESSSRVA